MTIYLCIRNKLQVMIRKFEPKKTQRIMANTAKANEIGIACFIYVLIENTAQFMPFWK